MCFGDLYCGPALDPRSYPHNATLSVVVSLFRLLCNSGGAAWGGLTSETTVQLAHNASADTLQTALEELGNVGAVSVERVRALPRENGGGGSYLITFLGSSYSDIVDSMNGYMSLSISAETSLYGTMADAAVEVVYPGSQWGGEFALSFGEVEGEALAFDAQPEEVQEAIEALAVSAGAGEDDNVEVWRETLESGYRWLVTFSGGYLDGNIDLLKVSTCDGLY